MEDTKNEDGMLKDTYPEKKKGWVEQGWKAVAHMINHLADQGRYSTEKNMEGIKDAMKEEGGTPPETKKDEGFKSIPKKVYK